jgi:hypothetical protein
MPSTTATSGSASTPSSSGPTTTWRRGGGGFDVTDERRPRRNPPPDQRPDPNEEFRRALERETDLSLREDPGDGCTGPWTCRVPGRPAMTDRRPRDGTTATTCSRGTARRSPSSGGRSGRASGSRHCSAGVARAGRSSRCLRRRQGRTGDDPTQIRVGRHSIEVIRPATSWSYASGQRKRRLDGHLVIS